MFHPQRSQDVTKPKQVSLRFHGALNDFLAPERRGAEFVHVFTGSPSVKDVIESLGPPHPEVDVVLANGEAVDFAHRIADGERIAAFPALHAFETAPQVRVGPPTMEMPRFVLDVGLGRLAGFLRMLGFDTVWRNDFADEALARQSREEGRILLTRDLGVLKRGEVLHGAFVRSDDPSEQLVEVVRRFRLTGPMRPFSRCLVCNASLASARPDEVRERVPEGVAATHSRFQQCPECKRVFWPGSHHARMEALVERLRTLEHEG
ncbi:Mut7-C RNAse domain-containing protein [Myxococcaceae bacterium GXIMD 01537]